MTSRRPKAQQGIQSIEVGGRVLRALTEAARPQMLRDIAEFAAMPPAKAHRYLVSLARMGLVQQQVETGLYDLGPYALELGLAAIGRLDPVSLAAPFLADLSRETGQTVAVAVWANLGATIVRWVGSDSPVSASLRVGSVMPLTRSATGIAFHAFSASETIERMARRELAENGRKGLEPSTQEAVDRSVERAKRAGFARTSDFIPGISGVAAPVFDHSGAMVLALIALGYSRPFDAAASEVCAAVLRVADALSTRLGFRTRG